MFPNFLGRLSSHNYYQMISTGKGTRYSRTELEETYSEGLKFEVRVTITVTETVTVTVMPCPGPLGYPALTIKAAHY